ncbi:MAG: helix-turn-helix domain-containing protein [Clostridia bacterium]|nr:helix-turn-helix domain-containing protein [Clostridia bacterium]
MAKKKTGDLIREARTKAGLSQAALAKATDISASDIGKAERNAKELTAAQLKAIAKATGVTQKSLLEASSGTSAKKPSAGTAKKTETAAKKTGSSGMSLTSAEKKLVELYRAADSETKRAATTLLKEGSSKDNGILSSILGSLTGNSSSSSGSSASALNTIMDLLGKK